MKKILLADDSQSIREYCREVLEEDGYCVVLAGDGLEAVRMFSEEAPDLVILDLRMPRLNGLETLQQIKSLRPEVPAIIFTANDDACVQDQRGQLAMACIEKTEDLTELQRAVVRGLRGHVVGDRSALRGMGLPSLPTPAERCACVA